MFKVIHLFWGILLVFHVQAQVYPSQVLKAKTLAQVEQFAKDWDGVVGVTAIDLTNGEKLSVNGEVIFPQASVIKIPIMLEVYKRLQATSATFETTLTVEEKFWVPGAGYLQTDIDKGKPFDKTILQLVQAMMEASDNVATNVLIDWVGMESVNRTLKGLGLGNTRLQRVMMDGDAVERNDENISTPNEMATLVQQIYEGKIVDKKTSMEMLDVMTKLNSAMRQAIPATYKLASKTGSVRAVRSEVGLVFLENRPFVISVMSTYNGSDDLNPVKEVTTMVFDYFERRAHSNIYGHRTNTPFQ